MDRLYHGTNFISSKAIVVVHRLDNPEGLRSFRELLSGWPGLMYCYLDEDHVVMILEPGGAMGLS